ncbi:MAG: lipoate--protein ligase A [Gemmatales bacterium]|nr:MAG: lipoate--protein ligase A [Gemmatales bacterium]
MNATLRYLHLTLPTIAENLALDEALLCQAEEADTDGVLRIWQWPEPAVVLGASSRLAAEVDEQSCRRDHVPLCRRSSGGAAVLLDHGCLVFALILNYCDHPALAQVRSSYQYILGQMKAALDDLVPGLALAGASDLVIGDRKFSGNSQQRKRRWLLHHGTILYDFDTRKVARYLKSPPRQPEYRRRRNHEDFLINLSAQEQDIIYRLRHQWQACHEIRDYPDSLVQRLVQEKYETDAWICRH